MEKRMVIIAAVALCFSAPAMAQNVGAVSGSQSQSAAQSGAFGGNNSNTINFPQQPDATNVNYSGKYTVRNTPSMGAPALSQSLTGTCLGSTSGAVAGFGLGAALGTTEPLTECNLRYDAQTLAGPLQDMELARAVMCLSPLVRKGDSTLAHPRCPIPAKPQRVAQTGGSFDAEPAPLDPFANISSVENN